MVSAAELNGIGDRKVGKEGAAKGAISQEEGSGHGEGHATTAAKTSSTGKNEGTVPATIPKKLEEPPKMLEDHAEQQAHKDSGAAVPATIPKKLEEPSKTPDDHAEQQAHKKSECPFLVPGAKRASPFLTSKLTDAPGSGPRQTDGSSERGGDSEFERATAKKQHDQIDEMIKDRSIFNTVAKVYFKDTKSNKLENRGEGKFAIVKDTTGLYKILMIRDKVMLLGCNHYIAKSCPLVRATQVPRSWIWIALNDKSDAEVNEPKTTYFATFKTDHDFELFEKKYNEAREANANTVLTLKKEEEKANKDIL